MPAAARRTQNDEAATVEPETTGQTPVGHLVPQPHGGALRHGGTNRGGPGAPPSAIRAGLRGSYEQRRAFLERVVDGEVMNRIEVPAAIVLRHARCPACGIQGMQLKDPDKDALLTFTVDVSASVKDRIGALEQMAKYGMGTLKEVSVENVRERMEATLQTIRSLLPTQQAEMITRAIEGHWK